MGMPFVMDNSVVIELNWNQMVLISLATTGVYSTRILSNKEVLCEQVRKCTNKLENLKLSESEDVLND